jgi:hypothetical protein
MGKIYNEAIKVNLFTSLTNRFCRILLEDPFIEVGSGFNKFGHEQELIVHAADQYVFDIEKVKRSTKLLYSEIQNFILESINEFSFKETYCFIKKALTDFELDFTEDVTILSEYFIKFYTKPKENIYQWRFQEQYNENELFRKKFNQDFAQYTIYYFEAGRKLHDLLLEMHSQFLRGHLITNYRFEDIENIKLKENELLYYTKMLKAIKKNQLEVLEYVFDNHRPVFVLHEDFNLSSLNLNGQVELSKYDINQTIILFELLFKRDILIEYDRPSLMSLLTGGSKQNLERMLGISGNKLLDGKKASRKSKEASNEYDTKDLKVVYADLLTIVDELKEKINIADKNK